MQALGGLFKHFAALLEQERGPDPAEALGQVAPSQPVVAHALARAPREAGLQVIQPLQIVVQPPPRVHAGQSLAELQDIVRLRLHLSSKQLAEPVRRLADKLTAGEHAFGNELGGGAGGGGAEIGDEIADGEIDLMAHCRNDRQGRFKDGPSHGFLVESPEVLQATAAPGHQEQVQSKFDRRTRAGSGSRSDDLAVVLVQQADGGGDFNGGAVPLNTASGEQQFQGRIATPDHVQDIVQRGALRRGDDADALRVARQRPLALSREQAFGFKLFFELFKGYLEGPGSLEFNARDAQLILSASLIHGDVPAEDYFASILEQRAVDLSFAPEKDATELRAGIFEREVNVAGALGAEVGNLAADPELGEFFLELAPNLKGELGNGKDFAELLRWEELAKFPLRLSRFRHQRPIKQFQLKDSMAGEKNMAEVAGKKPDSEYLIAAAGGGRLNTGMRMRLLSLCGFLALPLATLLATAAEAPNQLTQQEKAAGWQLLFDGKTTQGWHTFKKTTFPSHGWVVEDGWLHCLGEHGGDVVSEGVYDQFELTWDWKLAPKGNSGLKYFVFDSRPSALGHEYQMLDDDLHPDAKLGEGKRVTASFYDVLKPTVKPPSKPMGEVNHSRVVVKGEHVEHWLNGVKVLEYDCDSPEIKEAIGHSKFKNTPEFGHVAKGHILLQDHESNVWFSNIKIRDLSAK